MFNVKKLKVYRDNLLLIKRVRTALVETCKCTGNCIDLPKWDAFISHYDPDTDVDGNDNSNQHDQYVDCTAYSDSNDETQVMLKIGGAFISLAVLIVGIVLFRYAVQNKTV